MPESDRILFALALESLQGVGRVTVGRILDHFETLAALRTYPREQVMLRLKSTPRLDTLIDRLYDDAVMNEAFDQARHRLADLDRRQVRLLVSGMADWPEGLARLPRSARPARLSVFGGTALLGQPAVGFFARPPLSDPAFELAQAILRRLMDIDIHGVAGLAHGFDVVLHKIAASPPRPVPAVMVCACGLARVEKAHRPVVRQSVAAGGALVSAFPLHHGPFAHDDDERALVQAGLSTVALFFEPRPETPEWKAMTWVLKAGRPVFGVAHADHPLPPRVHPLETSVDVEWIEAAVRAAGS